MKNKKLILINKISFEVSTNYFNLKKVGSLEIPLEYSRSPWMDKRDWILEVPKHLENEKVKDWLVKNEYEKLFNIFRKDYEITFKYKPVFTAIEYIEVKEPAFEQLQKEYKKRNFYLNYVKLIRTNVEGRTEANHQWILINLKDLDKACYTYNSVKSFRNRVEKDGLDYIEVKRRNNK